MKLAVVLALLAIGAQAAPFHAAAASTNLISRDPNGPPPQLQHPPHHPPQHPGPPPHARDVEARGPQKRPPRPGRPGQNNGNQNNNNNNNNGNQNSAGRPHPRAAPGEANLAARGLQRPGRPGPPSPPPPPRPDQNSGSQHGGNQNNGRPHPREAEEAVEE